MSGANLKEFYKLNSDAHTTTLQHANGHTVRVVHSALSDKMRKALDGMPVRMAAGGMAGDVNMNAPQQPAPPQQQAPVSININATPQPQMPMAPAPVAAPVAPAPAPMPEAAPAAPQMMGDAAPSTMPGMGSMDTSLVTGDQFGIETQNKIMQQGLQKQLGGLEKEAQVKGQLGRAEAGVYAKQAQQLQGVMQQYQQKNDELMQENAKLVEDVQKNEIDPRRFYGSLSTGEKIATGIGMVLAGAGSGMLGQENPVMKFLNQQIDRDVDAQRANITKKQNLLTVNMQRMGNLRDAMDVTKAMMLETAATQIKMQASKLADQDAQARAMQAAGVLQSQAAPMLAQVAMRQALMGGGGAGAGRAGGRPELRIRALVPEERQKQYYEELSQAEQFSKVKDDALGAFDEIAKLQTLGSRATKPIQSTRRVDALWNSLVPTLSRISAGQFSEADAEMLKDLRPNVTDDKATVDFKRQKLMKLIKERANFPMLRSIGISAEDAGRFGKSGEKKIKLGKPEV